MRGVPGREGARHRATPDDRTRPQHCTGAAGTVAVATAYGRGSRVYVTEDLGQSWWRATELGFPLADLAWIERADTAVLLLAGEKGLYELTMAEGSVPVQNLIDPTQPDRGFYAVDSFVDVRGRTGVVVAAEAAARHLVVCGWRRSGVFPAGEGSR